MSLLNTSWKSTEVRDFTGPRPLLGVDHLSPTDAIEASNVEFPNGSPQTRRGWVSRFTSGAVATINDLAAWFGSNFYRLVYLSGTTDVRVKDLVGGDDRTLATITASEAIAFATYGVRGYLSGYTSQSSGMKQPVGAGSPYVLGQDPAAPATIQADQLWPAAPSSSYFTGVSFTEDLSSSPTFSTPGVHNLYIVVTTRTGFKCKPINPSISLTTTGYGWKVSLTVGAGVPAQYAYAELAFSTADQPTDFYIPINPFPNVPSYRFDLQTPATYTNLPIYISDEQLSLGTSGVDLQNKFTQGSPFTFSPYVIEPFQQRMAYIGLIPETTLAVTATQAGIMFSDAGSPQDMDLSRSLVQLPNQQMISAGKSLRGVFYAFGPGYTYAIPSTSGDPVTWPVPSLVDGSIGASRPGAVADGRGYLWVADDSGLYVFDGSTYPDRPISYYQGAAWWARINWNAPQGAIRVVDNPEEQTVSVWCPLDAETVPNYELKWNYQRGRTPEQAIFSTATHPTMGRAFGKFLDPTTGIVRMVRAVGNAIWQRRLATDTTYTDNGTAITYTYEHAPLGDRLTPKNFNAVQLRAVLPGTATLSANDITGVRSVAIGSVTGSAVVKTITRFFSMQTEAARVKLTGTGFFDLSSIKVWWGWFVAKFNS